MRHAYAIAVGEPAREAAVPRSLRDDLVRSDAVRAERHDAREAAEFWRGLIAGRLAIVECFERDGRRYYLARENEPASREECPLTHREGQVLGYVELGHSNKLIADLLGISTSTVSTLACKARRKLASLRRSPEPGLEPTVAEPFSPPSELRALRGANATEPARHRER